MSSLGSKRKADSDGDDSDYSDDCEEQDEEDDSSCMKTTVESQLTISESSNSSDVYRGFKGAFHRKQKKKRRVLRNVNWDQRFADIVCGGNRCKSEEVLKEFLFLIATGLKRSKQMVCLKCLLLWGAKKTFYAQFFTLAEIATGISETTYQQRNQVDETSMHSVS